MKTEEEAIHFLKSAEIRTGRNALSDIKVGEFNKWKIFTSEENYENYLQTRKHKR